MLVQHAVYFAGQTEGMDMLSFRYLLIGTTGFLLFFMISGFVMAAQIGQGPQHFALRRVLRIYPGYLLAMAGSFLLFALFRPAEMPELSLNLSLLLLPNGELNNSFHVPYWTLIYEMFFYFVLFLLILLRFKPAWYAIFMLAWTLAILLAPVLGIKSSSWNSADIAMIPFAPFNLFFVGGFLLFGALHGSQRLAYVLWLMVVMAELIWLGAVMSPYYAKVILGGAVLLALASLLPRISWPWFLVRLGDWSYGLYLMHLPIIVLLYLFLKEERHGFWLAFAILLGAGLVGGGAFGFVEYFLYRDRMRPLADRLSSRSVPEVA